VTAPVETGLSLGSNLGDRLGHLRQARAAIAAIAGVTILAQSPVYETDPVDVPPQYAALAFLNAVLVIGSPLPPDRLAVELRRIESEAGRVRSAQRNAPRPLDIDLLYAADLVVRTPALVLPHPRWAERRFVAQPLADVRRDLRLPGEKRSVQAVLDALPAHPRVTRFADVW
jgi:2-amino-4-hydroxy-6-hydroxymethyldihydropteridine diphosphokinase